MINFRIMGSVPLIYLRITRTDPMIPKSCNDENNQKRSAMPLCKTKNRPHDPWTNDAHKPAHAHVIGKGNEVRVGPNGKPLKGQPELSTQQKKVVDNHRKALRKEVKAIGKENKRIEDR